MTGSAMPFMGVSWTFVLGLVGWSYWRILRPGARPNETPEA